jgi:tRNA A-37 threonylcarbamoyl transferase component Bud32
MAAAAPQLTATTSTEDELDPPLPFGRYQLSRRLGHGGFATVFVALEASAMGEPREVVLKRLHEHLSLDERSREAFLDEARLAISLRHPNIVNALDFGAIEGRPFLAMEYLLGADLDRVLERLRSQAERMNRDLALQIASDALEGLAYLHERRDAHGRPAPVVHRDVSPHNLFVTQSGVVKLLDFGIAKARARAIETTTGVIKGKFAYMSPEQANGEAVDPSADVWSMGVVLWEMLAGQRLFEASSAFSTLASSMLGPIPRLDKAAGVPTELANVVEKALARAPADRYQSARELHVALRGAWKSEPVDRTQVAALVEGLFGEALGRAREESQQRRIRTFNGTPKPSRQRIPAWLFALGISLASAVVVVLVQQQLAGSRDVERGAASAASEPARAAPPVTPVAPAPQLAPAPPAPAEVAPSAPVKKPAAVVGSGRLTLVTVPWSHVELKGRRIGTTPLVNVSLPAGKQRLVLTNPDTGARRTLDVVIESGKTVEQRVSLAPAP